VRGEGGGGGERGGFVLRPDRTRSSLTIAGKRVRIYAVRRIQGTEEQRGDDLFGEKGDAWRSARPASLVSRLDDIDPRGKSAMREAHLAGKKKTLDNFPGQGKFRDRDSRRTSILRTVCHLRKRALESKRGSLDPIDVDRQWYRESQIERKAVRSCERVTISFCE